MFARIHRLFAGRLTAPAARGRHPRAPQLEGGFTLIETLIASFVLVVGIGAFFTMLSISVKATGSSRAREGATNVAREILEDARTIPYAQLSPTDIVSELQAMNGLANTSGTSTWQITRRGYTYTVTVSECSIDDPKDKYGKHDSTFCADSNVEGTESEDSQPADMKRITADVKWSARGRSPVVHQVETLTAAGQTVGLTATGLKLLNPSGASVGSATEPVIASAATTELEFVVTTPASAAAVDWTLEGARQSPAPVKKSGSTTEWVFKWAIPSSTVSDGTYQVGAQAVDSTGVDGPPVSISVTLARNVPAAPKGIEGGFNTITEGGKSKEVAEFQWLANSEKNVIGYRVYYVTGGSEKHKLVCETSSKTLTCVDREPPKPTSPNLTYEFVALYHKPEGNPPALGAITEGTAALFTIEGGPPPAPSTPPELSAKKEADGSVKLTWTAPGGSPAVSFYRIYRGSSEYSGRYGQVSPAGTTTFTDTKASTTHSYWVTAVSKTLTESKPVGPVTG